MIIFPLPCPFVIRHPSRSPSSGPPTRHGIVWARRTHAVTVPTDTIPTITRGFVTSWGPMGRGSAQPSLYGILREALGRRNAWDLIEIWWSSGVRGWSRIAAWEGTKLMLRQVMEPGLLGQTREDLCSIPFGLSI
jgi:hypothetical protein